MLHVFVIIANERYGVGYRSLQQCVRDLEKHGHLVRIKEEIDPNLEIAEIQRRVYEAQGPALFFENVKGSDFPAVSNLFGTMERSRFMFRDTLSRIRKIMIAKANPAEALKKPFSYAGVPFLAIKALPVKARFSKPILYGRTSIDKLPAIKSWPNDGGPFVTLPQVFTEDPDRPGPMKANVGMYRVQLSGNQYETNRQIGIHYQIHRGIGVHHSKYLERGEDMRVCVVVGGPPSHSFGAVMPLPEGLSETMFMGLLGNRRWRHTRKNGYLLSSDADFVITGKVVGRETMPEGPFGDHLGYYSLQHDFPVMQVEEVYHRKGAIWPFTVVGRPPQEDTSFGQLIHEITEPVVPSEIPGLHAMHAVDAAGVHPLLLAIGSERYVPYGERIPQELLTIANAVLGFGQASLAKYLIIGAQEDDPSLDLHDISKFLQHVLKRVDWTRDLHFQTKTTIDTLDYSGSGFNSGSKVVIAAAGKEKRTLGQELNGDLSLPEGFNQARIILPGILAVSGPKFQDYPRAKQQIEPLLAKLKESLDQDAFPLITLVDDAGFCAQKLKNWLWVAFTRSNPSHDLYGVDAFTEFKHWGCKGSLLIDARIKPFHAPPLIEDPAVSRRVNDLAASGGPLHGII